MSEQMVEAFAWKFSSDARGGSPPVYLGVARVRNVFCSLQTVNSTAVYSDGLGIQLSRESTSRAPESLGRRAAIGIGVNCLEETLLLSSEDGFPLLTQMRSCCECISTWLSHSKGLSFT